jgi:hypothetical protein
MLAKAHSPALHPVCDDSGWPLVHVELPATTVLDDSWIDGVMSFVEQCAARGPCVLLCEALHVPLPNPRQRRRLANAVAQLCVAHGVDHVKVVLVTPFPMVIEGLVRAVAWLLPDHDDGKTSTVIVVDTRNQGQAHVRALLQEQARPAPPLLELAPMLARRRAR